MVENQQCLYCKSEIPGAPDVFRSYVIVGVGPYCKICYDRWREGELLAAGPGGQLVLAPVKTQQAAEQTEATVLEEAASLIYGDRQQQYGNARTNFGDIGKLWEPILGVPVEPEEVALCLLQLKVARAINDVRVQRPIKRDTIVDLAGYAGCIEKIQRGV